MAPWGNKWLSKGWSKYTEKEAPWIKPVETAVAVLIAPLLAVLLTFADLIETWATAVVIDPVAAIGQFGSDLIWVVFRGREYFPNSYGDGTFGLIRAINSSWASILTFVSQLSLPSFPVALILILMLAFVIGKVINRG